MNRLLFATFLALPIHAGIVMYGGNGGQGSGVSINDGWLVTIDQNTAAVTPVGHPAGVSRISGLAFDLNGNLYVTTLGGGGFPPPPPPNTTSNLLQLNPATGAIISTIGQVHDSGGAGLSMADLAIQPGTGTLFGVRSPNDLGGGAGRLYTIDKSTGLATLVGSTGHFFGSIAFAPDGTLYMSSADNLGMGPANPHLLTLNPATAGTLTSVATADSFGALGVRPDGVIFGGTGDTGNIDRINPITGAETLVGNTGQNLVGDLDFQVPEPGTLGLFSLGMLTIVGAIRRRRATGSWLKIESYARKQKRRPRARNGFPHPQPACRPKAG
jgi:hypothetical protein